MSQPNLPQDGRSHAIQAAGSIQTFAQDVDSGTAAVGIVIPDNAIAVTFWVVEACDFEGIGADAGTAVALLTNTVYTMGCAGGGYVWFEGSSDTIVYGWFHMGVSGMSN